MRYILRCSFLILLLLCAPGVQAQRMGRYPAIYSGVPWLDDSGNTVSAHGANIVKDNGRYYLFGERHSDTSNAFAGFNCYSSADLYNWKFESVALPLQPSGKLGPNRVGERPKVMQCPSTGEYILYMHADTLGYRDPFVGYATAKTITGPYTFRGPLLFQGKPIRKWDMGAFRDQDGSGYILLHGGDIYRLADDYKSIAAQVNKAMARGFESPALFRKDSLYYFLGSDLTGWERNDNYYYTATALSGPWTKRGYIAPAGTLTWNAQTTFVLPVTGTEQTTFMFMGDRWSFPRQASAATYVWQPLKAAGHILALPEFYEAWEIDGKTGAYGPAVVAGRAIAAHNRRIRYSGVWQRDTLKNQSADKKGASFTVSARTTRLGFYGLARPDGGYADVVIRNSRGRIMVHANVDMYAKHPAVALKFLSPVLPNDHYTMTVTVLAEHWYWVEKSGRRSGSSGDWVSVDRILVGQ
ncbi:family 43 glycosylhydrolase [Niabella aurantiaca]|uniref:family 43 glycosylhydrolase n=1 Tax=Niabella aurantiaca TaxID=379900 RepID=UPI001B7FC8B0|nr:family 43 glycosylhydrolase [Niabella aurantiaca]